MKKYLMTGIAALAMCAAFTSCSHDVEPVSQEDLNRIEAQKIVDNYNQAFIKTFGQPAANQDWGFASRQLPASFGAVTRTANTNGNQWGTDYGYKVPDAISAAEREAVLAVFNQVGAERYTSLVDWNVYFVQQVYKGVATYQNHDNQTVTGSEHMDWLCTVTNKQPNIQWWPWDPKFTVGTQNYDDHINNFNNGNCTANGGMTLMVATDTHTFGFKSSEDNGHVFYNFRMEYIAPYGYFVGFDFEANGDNPNEQVDRDFIYNDWIVKIVPGDGIVTPPAPRRYTVRIICEDLMATGGSDFDFNDVVFDASYVEGESKTYITIKAAGGTIPLYIEGKEVHKIFQEKYPDAGIVLPSSNVLGTMINTHAVGGVEVGDASLVIDRIIAPWDIAITIDSGNGFQIPLKAETGSPAAKIAVNPTFTWCNERDDITKLYQDFSTYVMDTNVNWYDE